MVDYYPYYRIGMFSKECHPNAKFIPTKSQKLKNNKFNRRNKKKR